MTNLKATVATGFAVLTLFAFADVCDADNSRKKPSKNRKPTNALSRVCPKGIKSVPFGFLWKPASDVPGPRGGKPVVLLTGRNKTRTSSLVIFSSSGNNLCKFNHKASDEPGVNGGADHYYSGWGSGCGKTGSQLRGSSPNGSVYVGSTGGTCIGPINPTARVGGI